MDFIYDKKLIAKTILCLAARLDNYASRHFFEPNDMKAATFWILSLLHKDKSMNPTEIMDKIGGSKSNITQRLNWLEAKNYIMRVPGKYAGDSRKIAVALTPLGKKKFLAVANTMKNHSVVLEELFTEREKKSFYAFSDKLHSILDEAGNCKNKCKKY